MSNIIERYKELKKEIIMNIEIYKKSKQQLEEQKEQEKKEERKRNLRASLEQQLEAGPENEYFYDVYKQYLEDLDAIFESELQTEKLEEYPRFIGL